MAAMNTVIVVVAVIGLVPAGIVLLETLASLFPRRAARGTAAVRPTVAVLVPAHDEQTGIAQAIETIRKQCRESDRIVVVADNCTDATASLARAAGAEVVERADLVHRGKGYALDFGLRHLAPAAPGVVVIIDADCTLHPGSLDALAMEAAARDGACQSLNWVEASPGASLKQRISAFAFRFKNQVRATGLVRLGVPCLLTGTGMAFSWNALSRVSLASGEIVEDMVLALDLARKGEGATLVEGARVTSRVPETDAAWRSQRTRWEHGHLAALMRHAPRLLRESMFPLRPALAMLALDLSVPPLSLLVALQTAMLAIAIAWGVASALWTPSYIAFAGLATLSLAVVLGWLRCGREIISLGALLSAPLYVLAKLPLYVRFLLRPQRGWVRTARTGEMPSSAKQTNHRGTETQRRQG
ncbi:N-glycosyltransferase [Phycisphaerae bacterium RAS1]|nr:N-glycosyltransferase [Phycisphaerae bacterium RAS1]